MRLNRLIENGKTLAIHQVVTLNQHAEENGIGWCGLRVEILVLKQNRFVDSYTVGIHALADFVDGFHDLDGEVEDRTGYWLTTEEAFNRYLDIGPCKNQYIKKNLIFKEKHLKGMKCQILGSIGDDYMIELEEDVCGTSADGLGKKGHCITIPQDSLGEKTKKSKRAKKK